MKRDRKKREYRALLANLRDLARSEERDWDEATWRAAVARATSPELASSRPARTPRLRWAWAYAAAGVIVLAAGAVVTRNFLHRPEAAAAGEAAAGAAREAAPAGGAAGRSVQDRLSLTLVSGESGLRVYWYFDKEFDWKEEK